MPKNRSLRLGAIFVDWDNLVIPTEADLNFNISKINICLMRALLEASLNFVDKAYVFIFTAKGNIKRNYFLEADADEFGFELIIVSSSKNAADKAIKLKAEKLINEEDICTFIFASGDGYFIPTVRKLITHFGKKVILMPYCKAHHLYRRINKRNGRFNIIFLKPYLYRK